MKTVFVSSTYLDLQEHRKEVWDVLEEFDVNVRGMEQFGARSEEPLETCINEVEQSDVYVGIVGYRLGSVHEDRGLSFTQMEYERARELELEILIYLIDEEAEIKAKHIDKGEKLDKLESFKRTLRERHTVDTFTTPSDIGEKIRRDFRRVLGPPEGDGKDNTKSEIDKSSDAIEKFLLIPKAVSGREILLDLELKGEPFPASKDICTAFNLSFGATVGIQVEIKKPEGYGDSDLSHLFVRSKNLEEIWPINEGQRRRVYAKLQFTENEIDKIKTRFKSETKTYRESDSLMPQSQLSTLSREPFREKTVHLEAEGNVILLYTKKAEFEKQKDSASKGST
jgi:hypothetical protein